MCGVGLVWGFRAQALAFRVWGVGFRGLRFPGGNLESRFRFLFGKVPRVYAATRVFKMLQSGCWFWGIRGSVHNSADVLYRHNVQSKPIRNLAIKSAISHNGS